MDSRVRHVHASRAEARQLPLRWFRMIPPGPRDGGRPRQAHGARANSLRSILRRRGGASPQASRSRRPFGVAISVRRSARPCDVQETSRGGPAHSSMISSEKEPTRRRTEGDAKGDQFMQAIKISEFTSRGSGGPRVRPLALAGVRGGPRSGRSGSGRYRYHRGPGGRSGRSRTGCCGYPPRPFH